MLKATSTSTSIHFLHCLPWLVGYLSNQGKLLKKLTAHVNAFKTLNFKCRFIFALAHKTKQNSATDNNTFLYAEIFKNILIVIMKKILINNRQIQIFILQNSNSKSFCDVTVFPSLDRKNLPDLALLIRMHRGYRLA